MFGTNTPKQFGGLGLSMLGSCIAIEDWARRSYRFLPFLSGVNVHIGSKAIEFFATGAVRDR